MNRVEKRMRLLRKMEEELAYAPPKKAAKLTGKIVKLKAAVFDGLK